jgi:hypothetical protein
MERMEMDLYDTMHYWKAYHRSPSRLKLSSFNQLIYSRLPPRLVCVWCSDLLLKSSIPPPPPTDPPTRNKTK